MRKGMTSLIAVALLMGVIGGASAKPVAVWEDAAGDTGTNNTGGVAELAQAGFDLVGGSIDKVGKNLEFTVTHASMPPVGAIPETFRFLWAFNVNGTDYRITAKAADIGKPDVLAGQTTDRVGTVEPTGHFRLEGNCATGATVGVVQPVNCEHLASLTGAFDAASASFTVVIPMELVKAKTGSKIAQGGGDAMGICTICWVSHLAERSHEDTIIDSAIQTKVYKVPK